MGRRVNTFTRTVPHTHTDSHKHTHATAGTEEANVAGS